MRDFHVRELLLASAAAAALSGAVACGDDGGGGGGSGGAAGKCFEREGFDATTPREGFKTSVLPLFQRSCGVAGATCHGAESGSVGKTYLGPSLGNEITAAQLLAIQDQNVGVDASRTPEMKRIVAGDPGKSFLMHKLDGDFGCELLACTPDCGDQMPQGSGSKGLPAEERDVIRRWIAQGATFE